MARTKPADQRREDLLDAAQAAILERGIGATTVEHITTGAGVAKGTFYLYFRSKEDAVAAVQHRYGSRFARQLADAIDRAGDDWAARIDACVAASFQDYVAELTLHDVLFAQVSQGHRGELDESRDERIGIFRELLADGVAAGAYDVPDVDTTALLLFSAIHGTFGPIWIGIEPRAQADLVDAAQLVFRRTVGLPDPPRELPNKV